MKFTFIFLLIFYISVISVVEAKPPALPHDDDDFVDGGDDDMENGDFDDDDFEDEDMENGEFDDDDFGDEDVEEEYEEYQEDLMVTTETMPKTNPTTKPKTETVTKPTTISTTKAKIEVTAKKTTFATTKSRIDSTTKPTTKTTTTKPTAKMTTTKPTTISTTTKPATKPTTKTCTTTTHKHRTTTTLPSTTSKTTAKPVKNDNDVHEKAKVETATKKNDESPKGAVLEHKEEDPKLKLSETAPKFDKTEAVESKSFNLNPNDMQESSSKNLEPSLTAEKLVPIVTKPTTKPKESHPKEIVPEPSRKLEEKPVIKVEEPKHLPAKKADPLPSINQNIVVHETEGAKVDGFEFLDSNNENLDFLSVKEPVINPQMEAIVEEEEIEEDTTTTVTDKPVTAVETSTSKPIAPTAQPVTNPPVTAAATRPPKPTAQPVIASSTQPPSTAVKTKSPLTTKAPTKKTAAPVTQQPIEPKTQKPTPPPNAEFHKFMLRPRFVKIQKLIRDKPPSICTKSIPFKQNSNAVRHACIINQELTYDEANKLCRANEMDLFAIDKIDTHQDMKLKATDVLELNKRFWINGRRINDLWYYINSENNDQKRLVYPGVQIDKNISGNCMNVHKVTTAQGPQIVFTGLNCDLKSQVICEYSMH